MRQRDRRIDNERHIGTMRQRHRDNLHRYKHRKRQTQETQETLRQTVLTRRQRQGDRETPSEERAKQVSKTGTDRQGKKQQQRWRETERKRQKLRPTNTETETRDSEAERQTQR